ncbi:hypothetical protein AAur_0679 [Paenarthrobacter aurescens TC1]|uniref:Uncharacterized protein n=1 Tax=Paenarthrobacter aurescens (strain TC1) TaxID=290340 RepID=A1R2M0_PAEAT|nr:hypothetical protein AAur_0679 [Paenarthrobacter aurescens TC1]
MDNVVRQLQVSGRQDGVRLHRYAICGPDVHVLHIVIVVVKPVCHGVVRTGITHCPPGERGDALRCQEFNGAAGSEVLAQADGFDVRGDDGGVQAVIRGVIGPRCVVVQDGGVEAMASHDVQGIGVEEFLFGQVILAGHVHVLLHGDHGALCLIEEHMRGVVFGNKPADIVAVGLGHGEFVVHVDRARTIGCVAEPHGAFLANSVNDSVRRHSRSNHGFHDLLADERVRAARVENDGDPGRGKGHHVRNDVRLDVARHRAGDRAIDIQQQRQSWRGAGSGPVSTLQRLSHDPILSAPEVRFTAVTSVTPVEEILR